MLTESAEMAPEKSRAGRRTGCRKITPQHLRVARECERFEGLPKGVTSPGQLLAAFKEAAPHLGLSLRVVHAVDWLFRFTWPQDWKQGARPIVWPSASLQRSAFCLSTTRVKALNCELIEAGLITAKDSPNGKRYGKRNPAGRIIEAYGFDLSPLAARYAEFRRIADQARTERAEMGRLRRRATLARKGIVQVLETAAESCLVDEEWTTLAEECQRFGKALHSVERLEEMAFGVARLERRWRDARDSLESRLAEHRDDVVDAHTGPKGSENGPLNTYKPAFYAQEHTVVAAETVALPKAGTVREQAAVVRSGSPARVPSNPEPTEIGLRVTPGGLVELVPCLGAFLPQPNPSWPDIIDAAGGPLCRKLDIPQSLWGGACLTMGRTMAAIALAIVSTKPMEHFRSTPGGYFHGMVEKAKVGQLNLERSIRGLRYAKTREPSNGKETVPVQRR